MGNALKDILAKTVTSVRPQLLYYKADSAARRGITVTASGDSVDVVDQQRGRIVRIARTNAIYVVDMIESFDFFFESAEPVTIRRNGRMYQLVDFSTPRLHHVAGFDDFAVLCPSLTEPYETTAQYLDFAALTPGAVAIDLGSYSALTSIAFSKAVGSDGRVVAVEPDPLNFEAAAVNIATHRRVNQLDNIELVAAAVSDRPGTLRLSSEGAMGSALTSIVGGYRGEAVEVEALTLQGLADRSSLDRVDFIKMDIEGAEMAVVLGNQEFLARFKPRMVIEAHLVGGVLTSDPVTRSLDALGFTCEMVEQHGMSLPLIMVTPPAG